MGLLDFFRKKKIELTEDQRKWNKMWDLWTEGLIESPYAELMTYQSEVNNGGHDQYFSNVSNISDLPKALSALETILSAKLNANLKTAYKAYLVLEENEDDENAAEIIAQCDAVFYENEAQINLILEKYAVKIE